MPSEPRYGFGPNATPTLAQIAAAFGVSTAEVERAAEQQGVPVHRGRIFAGYLEAIYVALGEWDD